MPGTELLPPRLLPSLYTHWPSEPCGSPSHKGCWKEEAAVCYTLRGARAGAAWRQVGGAQAVWGSAGPEFRPDQKRRHAVADPADRAEEEARRLRPPAATGSRRRRLQHHGQRQGGRAGSALTHGCAAAALRGPRPTSPTPRRLRCSHSAEKNACRRHRATLLELGFARGPPSSRSVFLLHSPFVSVSCASR